MDRSGPSPTADGFVHVHLDALRRAVDLYLAVAYPGGPIPEPVRRRLEWDADRSPSELLIKPPFERVGRGPNGCPIVALRLGNARYPHMKLQVQPWESPQGFLLSVNSHDQVLTLDPSSPDAGAFRTLQCENQRVKEAIEQAWDEEGLPTFLRYLRDYIAANPSPLAT